MRIAVVALALLGAACGYYQSEGFFDGTTYTERNKSFAVQSPYQKGTQEHAKMHIKEWGNKRNWWKILFTDESGEKRFLLRYSTVQNKVDQHLTFEERAQNVFNTFLEKGEKKSIARQFKGGFYLKNPPVIEEVFSDHVGEVYFKLYRESREDHNLAENISVGDQSGPDWIKYHALYYLETRYGRASFWVSMPSDKEHEAALSKMLMNHEMPEVNRFVFSFDSTPR